MVRKCNIKEIKLKDRNAQIKELLPVAESYAINYAKKFNASYVDEFKSIAYESLMKSIDTFNGKGSIIGFVRIKIKFAIIDYIRTIWGKNEHNKRQLDVELRAGSRESLIHYNIDLSNQNSFIIDDIESDFDVAKTLHQKLDDINILLDILHNIPANHAKILREFYLEKQSYKKIGVRENRSEVALWLRKKKALKIAQICAKKLGYIS